jgi:hypothetical protein
MFFLGAHIEPSAMEITIVVIQKKMKNIKNYYTLCGVHPVSLENCQKALSDLYWDPKFRVRKRVYSQDRRPKKDVSAHPKIVVAGQGETPPDLLIQLRRSHIPADGLRVLSSKAFFPPSPPPSGIGRDFYVSDDVLIETAAALWQQSRLTISVNDRQAAIGPGESAMQNQLASELAAFLTDLADKGCRALPGPVRPVFLSMATPLWFRENVRYRRSYQSSAKSIRRFT